MSDTARAQPPRTWIALLLAAHLLLLTGALSGVTNRLAFDTLYNPERGSTLRVLADGFERLLEGQGAYAELDAGSSIGPFDPMSQRTTPLALILIGGPFAALPSGWAFPAWLLLNEAALLVAIRVILRRVPERGTAMAIAAAWALSVPAFVALHTGAPVTLAALLLFGASVAEGRAGALFFGLTTALRPFFLGMLVHIARVPRRLYLLAAGTMILVTALLFLIHTGDFESYLTRHPYGESYPGNLGLQAFLFAMVREIFSNLSISIGIAGREIYDVNILSLIIQRVLVFAIVAFSLFASWRARHAAQGAAVAALWACTWIATGVEVHEADFLLVIAGAAAMAVAGSGSRWLPLAAIWLALPTPFGILPIAGLHDLSPEFGWSGVQIFALHGWKLAPTAIVYWISARACLSSYPSSTG